MAESKPVLGVSRCWAFHSCYLRSPRGCPQKDRDSIFSGIRVHGIKITSNPFHFFNPIFIISSFFHFFPFTQSRAGHLSPWSSRLTRWNAWATLSPRWNSARRPVRTQKNSVRWFRSEFGVPETCSCTWKMLFLLPEIISSRRVFENKVPVVRSKRSTKQCLHSFGVKFSTLSLANLLY